MKWKLPIVLAAATSAAAFAENDARALADEAREISRQYVATLKPELLSAIETGGLASAINFCSQRAPEIGAELSKASGWEVGRVSSRPRNVDTARADAWERDAIARLEAFQADGAEPESLEYSERIGEVFRFAKAQTVAPLCLNCHGETLSPEVSAALQKWYPSDQATGYQLGEIRGIISLEKNLE